MSVIFISSLEFDTQMTLMSNARILSLSMVCQFQAVAGIFLFTITSSAPGNTDLLVCG